MMETASYRCDLYVVSREVGLAEQRSQVLVKDFITVRGMAICSDLCLISWG